MNVRVYKKLYKVLLEKEHIERLPETVFVDVRDFVSAYAPKNGKVATPSRLQHAKTAYNSWLVRYHKERVRKPTTEVLASMQLLGILFLYVWHIESREGLVDDFLVEESLKEFNRNREYRRAFSLPQAPKRRGRPPLALQEVRKPVRRTAARKAAARKIAANKASRKR